MQYYEIAPTKIIRSESHFFTYASDTSLEIGHIVEIPVGSKHLAGIVLRPTSKPSYDTKSVVRCIESRPLPPHLVSLCLWIADYYKTPLALVLQAALPTGITKTRRKSVHPHTSSTINRTNIVLNKDQLSALDMLRTARGTWLLHGVTGSGKTAVYIERAKQALKEKKSVIILVPEIALTSQLVIEFSREFDDVLLTHSKQSEAERHAIWREVLTSEHPRVVIGPRSALFLPLQDIGLIVVDECHEPSFQQEQSPRYSALRVASKYASLSDSLTILGSATPLVSDYYLAKQTRHIIELPSTARLDAQPPTVSVINMTDRVNFKAHRFISDVLLQTLEETFASGKQALIFHNRRGSANSTLCENCGWQAGCPRCYIPLSLHADSHTLRCHICATTLHVPTSCPECGHVDIVHKGIGTKLIESELQKLFPRQTIARFDADTQTDQTLDQQFDKLKDGSIDLIIGTQVVAKGLDLPHLRTVGVIQADAGLSLPDYASTERTFQLLSQVIGRVGRSRYATSVILQSYQPTHPAIVDGISQNYTDFYDRTLALRRHTRFPPFTYLLQLTCSYKTEAAAIKNAQAVARKLRLRAGIEILGPTPSFYERSRDTYRWQIVAKSQTRQALVDALADLPPKSWQFELDPISLL